MTKNWVEIVYETCNKDSQINFKTSMLKSSLCDYSDGDAYILLKETINVAPAPATNPDNNNKEVVFKNCAPYWLYKRYKQCTNRSS